MSTKAGSTMGNRILLQVTSRRHPRGERGAILTAAGIVAALVLTLSAAAVVQLSGGSLRGSLASSDTRQARGAAAEGIDLMIATWNQPGNRALLVSGVDPASWAVGTPALANPCSNPGAPAHPTLAAIDLADGSWRDVVTGAAADANTDGRQFRLLSITSTASTPALRRTATPGGGSSGDPIPPGGWRSLINLTSPAPGPNTGYLVLEVEGRVVRDSRVVTNSRLTQEFQVLPKLCGCSLGSGGADSLGADRREPSDFRAGEDWVARGPTSSRLW